MLTVTVCKFKRKKDSPEENGIVINNDVLIIDANGKPVKKVYDHHALAFKGHIVFNILRHWPSRDDGEEEKPAKKERRRFTMTDKTGVFEKNITLGYLLTCSDFNDKEVNHIASLENNDTYITSDKITITRTR